LETLSELTENEDGDRDEDEDEDEDELAHHETKGDSFNGPGELHKHTFVHPVQVSGKTRKSNLLKSSPENVLGVTRTKKAKKITSDPETITTSTGVGVTSNATKLSAALKSVVCLTCRPILGLTNLSKTSPLRNDRHFSLSYILTRHVLTFEFGLTHLT
jgi:hypothetical protein